MAECFMNNIMGLEVPHSRKPRLWSHISVPNILVSGHPVVSINRRSSMECAIVLSQTTSPCVAVRKVSRSDVCIKCVSVVNREAIIITNKPSNTKASKFQQKHILSSNG